MEIDFNARYTAPDFRGVALAPIRYATRDVPVMTTATVCRNCSEEIIDTDEGWLHAETSDPDCRLPYLDDTGEPGGEVEVETGEVEQVEDREWIICIMVGDDTERLIETDTLVKIDDDDYCHECGQIGCGHDGRDRS